VKYAAILSIVLLLFFSGCAGNESSNREKADMPDSFTRVSAETAVLNIINHPAFEGFGRFLFPTEYRIPGTDMKLNNIGSLLPYHRNINTYYGGSIKLYA
jgi:hypothetical protein